uniref:PilW family protein n=1 Tax=uncultured Meiothermus sp. TaxID=157471 RepID=UPI002601D53D
VELLIAMGILAGILALVAVYFGDQRDLTLRTQSRSEVQDRVRMVMQMVTQDLQMVGSRGFLDSSGNLVTTVSSGCSGANCLTSTDEGVQDGFTVQYVTNLRASTAQPCRGVSYAFSSNTLQRSDVPCGGAVSLVDLAPDILAMDILYQCSNNTTANTSAGCPAGSFPRSARVTVIGQSTSTLSNIASTSHTTSSGSTVNCPSGRICLALTQEVLMPNLKN